MMKRLPSRVEKLLTDACVRVRRLHLVRGIARTGIVWILSVVAVMIVDSRIVIFDDRVRVAMTMGVWLLTLVAAFLFIVRPLRRQTDFRKMATILDARHSEHEERLMTLVALAEKDATEVGFSASLFGLVCNLAEQDAAKIDLRREFPMRGAGRRLSVLAFLICLLGLGAAVSPNLIGRLFVRAVAPWVQIGNLFAKDIIVTPGDVVLLSGSVLRIEAAPADPALTNRQPLATNHYSIRLSRKRGYSWTEETSEPMVNGIYETTTDLTEREWRYRVTAGPAVTRYYHVRVSEMPKYDLFQATVQYPDYTEMKPLVITNADVGAIKAVAGSRVTFDVKVPSPDTVVDFRINRSPLDEHLMVSNRTANWSLDLVNGDGFRAEKGRGTLTSFVDQPPTVVIEKPTGTLRLPPHAKIPVEITAADDIAITAAYLRVSIDHEPWEPYFRGRLDLSGERRFIRQIADVDLSLYNLIFAKNVRFDVVVEDACPPEFGGPHSATSMPFTVQFAENESSYEMKELKKEVEEARRDIDEARKRLNDAQNLARQVRDELRRTEKPSEHLERKSEQMAHELNEAEKRIEALRDEFREDARFEPLTHPMDKLLDETVKPTLENVEKAQFREKNERAEEIDKAIPEMAKAAQALNELTKKLAERAEKVDQFEKTRDLAARQEALARAAKEILEERPTDTAKLEAWKRLEEATMRKAAEFAHRKPDSEFAEARRKMEAAARKMADVKRELEGAKAKANAEKRAAANRAAQTEAVKAAAEKREAEQQARQRRAQADAQARDLQAAVNEQKRAMEALKKAAQARAEEAKRREAKNVAGANAKAREAENFERVAAMAQRSSEDRMESGEAKKEAKASQRQATQAAREARQLPHAENANEERAAHEAEKMNAARAAQQAEKTEAAMAAQQAAMEALKKELAERQKTHMPNEKPQSAAEAAEAAAQAMKREVKSQAEALGMSAEASEQEMSGQGGEKGEEDSAGGGGVSDEVQKLAKSLKRNDRPDFMKDLFARFGWFKVRGVSKPEQEEIDLKDIPREYRDLVRRYFLKLAEEGKGDKGQR